MDVYHKVLVKLYEVTGGKDSQSVDFKDLVKGEGFLGNYNDIFDMLSSQGWIAETQKQNYVSITHWGVSEAKKSANGASDGAQELLKEVSRLANQSKELINLVEEFSSDVSKKKLENVDKTIDELKVTIAKLKNIVH